MQLDQKQILNSRLSCTARMAVSISTPKERSKDDMPPPLEHGSVNHRSRNIPMPKQLLDGADICSRFEKVSGKGMPKRMTTGKFVYLGSTNLLPDYPLWN
ncbi:hypothetical protein [Malonomonas rubra]|uniref:hypothetical protein n=1 Tax=Malonomonas rubra TaxID=57040 RepID=UPI0034E9875E